MYNDNQDILFHFVLLPDCLYPDLAAFLLISGFFLFEFYDSI